MHHIVGIYMRKNNIYSQDMTVIRSARYQVKILGYWDYSELEYFLSVGG